MSNTVDYLSGDVDRALAAMLALSAQESASTADEFMMTS